MVIHHQGEGGIQYHQEMEIYYHHVSSQLLGERNLPSAHQEDPIPARELVSIRTIQ